MSGQSDVAWVCGRSPGVSESLVLMKYRECGTGVGCFSDLCEEIKGGGDGIRFPPDFSLRAGGAVERAYQEKQWKCLGYIIREEDTKPEEEDGIEVRTR